MIIPVLKRTKQIDDNDLKNCMKTYAIEKIATSLAPNILPITIISSS